MRKQPPPKARSLLAAIRDLAAALPSTDERREALEALIAVETYLAEVRQWLEQLPSAPRALELQSALERLDTLVERADSNPLLARVFGESPKAKQRSVPLFRTPDPEGAQRLLDDLSSLSVDQVREKLVSDPTVTLPNLRGLAALLGLRHSSKISREVLANQLTMRIANERGYRQLSGQDGDTSSAAKGAADDSESTMSND